MLHICILLELKHFGRQPLINWLWCFGWRSGGGDELAVHLTIGETTHSPHPPPHPPMYTTVAHQACRTLCPSTNTADELGHKLHLLWSFHGWWLWVLLMWLEFEMFPGEHLLLVMPSVMFLRLVHFQRNSHCFENIMLIIVGNIIVYSSHMWLRKSVLQE